MAIEAEVKSKSCGFWKEISNSFQGKKGSPGFGTSAVNCISDIISSFTSSLTLMAKTAWGFISGLGTKVGEKIGLFKSTQSLENSGSNASMVLTGMSQETVKKAQEDGAAATRDWVDQLTNFFGGLVEFIGVDTPAIKELYQCAKCGEKISAICKIIGVLGKDSVKNALIIWTGGKTFQGLGWLKGKAIAGLEKTVAGRAFVGWGEKKFASVGAKAIAKFEKFTAKGIPKFLKKAVVKTFEVTDKAMNALVAPVRLIVKGGKGVAIKVAEGEALAKVFKRTPGLAAEGAETGLAEVAKVSSQPAELTIEANRPTTPRWAEAKKAVERQQIVSDSLNPKRLRTGTRLDVSDLVNSTETKIVDSNTSSIKVKAPTSEHGGHQFFKVEHPETIESVHVYGPEGRSAIIKRTDGSLLIAEQGRVATQVAKKDVKTVAALIDPAELAKSNDLLLKETIENAKANGIKMTEEVESKVATDVEKKASFETGPECGNQKIFISAGRGI